MAIDVGALQSRYPQWNIVDAIAAPNGGIWAVGRDGGVFALNAQGGTDGVTAPFLGSYTGLDPSQRLGDRYFTKIVVDSNTDGYTLISNRPGQDYNFKGQKPIGQGGTTTTEPTKAIDFTDADLNQLTATLNQHGLGDLAEDAWAYYKDPAKGAGDANATLAYLPTTQKYRDRFPGLVELGEQGRAWTPAQWNTYYDNLFTAATSAGLPPGMVSREDVGKMLVGGVSINEALGRIQAAGQSVYNADPAVIAKMRQFGFSDGDLTAFYLDADSAAPLLQRKAEEEQARISVAGGRAGYDIGVGRAQQLQQWGVDEAEAEQGFAKLDQLHPLFANTVEEAGAGESITEAEQLGAQFGQDLGAQREISTRRQRRAAAFEGGGGAATGGKGRTGIA